MKTIRMAKWRMRTMVADKLVSSITAASCTCSHCSTRLRNTGASQGDVRGAPAGTACAPAPPTFAVYEGGPIQPVLPLTKSELSGITEFMPDKPTPICQIDQIRRDISSLTFQLGIIMDQLERLPSWESVTPVAIFATAAGAVTGALLTLAFSH